MRRRSPKLATVNLDDDSLGNGADSVGRIRATCLPSKRVLPSECLATRNQFAGHRGMSHSGIARGPRVLNGSTAEVNRVAVIVVPTENKHAAGVPFLCTKK